jgi:diguanylate cyclase (GGDEF)-like protein
MTRMPKQPVGRHPARSSDKGLLRWLEYRLLLVARAEGLSSAAYADLVDCLYGTRIGYMSLVAAALLQTGLTFISYPGWTTGALVFAMAVVAIVRIALMMAYQTWRNTGHQANRRSMLRTIIGWEAAYAAVGVIMMTIIGVTSAFSVTHEADTSALAVSVMVSIGIAGCITGRNGSRPRIVAYQIIAVCTPFVGALAIHGTSTTSIIAVLTLVFFAAAMSSTKAQYRSLKTAIVNERRAKRLTESTKRTAMRLDTALNTMSNGLFMFDEGFKLVVANDRIKTMWGPELVESLVGKSASRVGSALFNMMGIESAESETFRLAFQKAVKSGRANPIELVDHRNNRIFGLRLEAATGGGVVVLIDDITEKRRQDDQIFRLAHADALTGVANRLELNKRLAEMIAGSVIEPSTVVMYLDLDGFKAVNDTFGHGVGDALLIEVARRIEASARATDVVARIGGDEFVICFATEANLAVASATAKRMIQDVSIPYEIEGRRIDVGASAGLAIIGGSTTDPEGVLREADVALYEAKTNARGSAVWFRTEMDQKAQERRELTIELRAAIEEGSLELHYQPVIDFRSGRIVCCEALARWTSPTRGIVPPDVFIPLAESTDLIHRLGRWSLTQACEDALQWPDPTVVVAVNLSARQFNGSITSTVEETLQATGLPANRLELEITEGVLADDVEGMKAEMGLLHELGVSMALDDFGMGYSSLSYIHTLPIEKVKLDRSFVRQLDLDPSAVSLIASIVQMTQTMRKELVIEGVETAQQLALVSQANGRLIQGFYFSRPLPQSDLIAYMKATDDRNDADAALKVKRLLPFPHGELRWPRG